MPYKTYQQRGGATRTSARGAAAPPTTATMEPEVAAQVKPEPLKETDMEQENDQKKGFFARMKEGGVQKKVPKSVQKKRNNYRLRRLVAPKAPLTVLNEMVGAQDPVQYQFIENTGGAPAGVPTLFTAQASVYGEIYTGTGPSKAIAKNICAEQAIQAIVAKKCFEKKMMKMEVEEEGEKPKQEDETPWASLASLALFKLFNDWQAQGYSLPEDLLKQPQQQMGTGIKTEGAQTIEKRSQKVKEIPTNPTEKHPVQLLNELTGPLEYQLTGEEGDLPNGKVFTMTVEVQENQYSGKGKNKKEAKKSAAIEALAAVYKINYPSA